MASGGQRTLDSWLSPKSAPASSSSSAAQEPTRSAPVKTAEQRPTEYTRRRAELAAVAKDTRTVLPGLLEQLPDIRASRAEPLFLDTLPPLLPADCPGHPKTAIRIINDDSFNTAISLASRSATSTLPSSSSSSRRVAVLNMASHSSPGGGWIRGALAQEEALCYRSSLSLSLHRRFYPWKQRMALYTRDVVVIRSDMPSGHNLLVPDVAATDLPVVSVLSIAAIRGPETRKLREDTPGGTTERDVYANPAARVLTKDKMRLCLRMAARRGHGLLVLGALGCGAFRNPKEEVAKCWLEVFQEAEFQGGWWEEVWFAVYDRTNEGNFEVFEDILGGAQV